ITGVFAGGSIAMVIGLMWNWSFPINKNLWTSSYVMFTAGMACVMLATIMWIVDYLNLKGWTKPFVVFGVNPIVAFVGSGVLARLIYTLWHVNYDGKSVSLVEAIYQSVYLPWLPPRVASLAFAISFVLLWYGILSVLYRRKIILKVCARHCFELHLCTWSARVSSPAASSLTRCEPRAQQQQRARVSC